MEQRAQKRSLPPLVVAVYRGTVQWVARCGGLRSSGGRVGAFFALVFSTVLTDGRTNEEGRKGGDSNSLGLLFLRSGHGDKEESEWCAIHSRSDVGGGGEVPRNKFKAVLQEEEAPR